MSELLLSKAVPPQWETAYGALLDESGLRGEDGAECVALVVEDARLLACGSLGGGVLRQIAVSPQVQGQDECAHVVTALVQEATRRGTPYPFLFTKPQNRRLFASLGFYPVAETADMLMMSRRKDGLSRFLAAIPTWDGVTGCVVCHADPFTRGHLHLITQAAKACDHVLVFVLSDEDGMFSAAERLAMVREGTARLENVAVCAGGDYLVSPVTFPAYFLKNAAAAEASKCALDLALFGGKIAPALRITRRFVGEEPFCPTTALYNLQMLALLPPMGVEVTVLSRLDGISATTVRKLLREGRLAEIAPLVPETTYEYCRRHLG